MSRLQPNNTFPVCDIKITSPDADSDREGRNDSENNSWESHLEMTNQTGSGGITFEKFRSESLSPYDIPHVNINGLRRFSVPTPMPAKMKGNILRHIFQSDQHS